MPEVSIPDLTCMIYSEENYQGTPQTVYGSVVVEFAPVKSVACGGGTLLFIFEETKEDVKFNRISSRGVPSLEGNPTDYYAGINEFMDDYFYFDMHSRADCTGFTDYIERRLANESATTKYHSATMTRG